MGLDLVPNEYCPCACHHARGVKHFVACCDGLPIDFWDKIDEEVALYGSAESTAKGRSSTYEEPSEWMSYIIDKKTGSHFVVPAQTQSLMIDMAQTFDQWEKGEKDPFFMPGETAPSRYSAFPIYGDSVQSFELKDKCPNCGGPSEWFYSRSANGVSRIVCESGCRYGDMH